MQVLVTGATGFVGGHVAKALVERGDRVRAVVRPTSDVAALKKLGVELVEGDLTDKATIERACDGIDAVVHCAAKVGDWGPTEEYRKVNVQPVRDLLGALAGKPLRRFVLVSSLGVYPARDHHGTDETTPPPARHIDGYTQTKVEAEQVAFAEHEKRQGSGHPLPLTVLRPGFIYGPGDRTVTPRIVRNLRKDKVVYVADKTKKLNQSYIDNVVGAILVLLDHPDAVGEAFNVRDPELVTKEEFFGGLAERLGHPKPKKTLPMWLAKTLQFVCEKGALVTGMHPFINGARVKFLGLNLDYSIDKIRSRLGYEPPVPFATGIDRTVQWLKDNDLG